MPTKFTRYRFKKAILLSIKYPSLAKWIVKYIETHEDCTKDDVNEFLQEIITITRRSSKDFDSDIDQLISFCYDAFHSEKEEG